MAAAPKKSRAKPRSAADTTASRRWPKVLLGAISLALVAAAGSFGYRSLLEPGRLPLRVIEVNGEFQQLDQAEIQHTVAATIDGGFFTCDMHSLRDAVLAMPWVADVSIRRVWPDKLRMAVTEQVPLARWGDAALINVAGEVFQPGELGPYSALVRLRGPSGSERRVVAFLQSVVPAARARGLQLDALELDERRHWWLRFDGGLTVSLGREDTENRLAQFLRVYPSLVAEQQRVPERVDMRYSHGFAVRWQTDAGDASVADAAQPRGKV
ncbi:MAG: FtsQ-type POTRA domain-containing protein [Chromatiaceae bacterium]|nr:FtsQ-type POTRA domain-containing protein [Chromatiaceae bacterium]